MRDGVEAAAGGWVGRDSSAEGGAINLTTLEEKLLSELLAQFVVRGPSWRDDPAGEEVDVYLTESLDCGASVAANVRVTEPSAQFNNPGISYSNVNNVANPFSYPTQYGEYMGIDIEQGIPQMKGLPCKVEPLSADELARLEAEYGPTEDLPKGPEGTKTRPRKLPDFLDDDEMVFDVEFEAVELSIYGRITL